MTHQQVNECEDAMPEGTTDRQALLAAMRERFEGLGLPYHELKVFGVIRCNVHVVALGQETAEKWRSVLGRVFPGASVSVRETQWRAVQNKETCLLPTMREGYLIAVAA
ncbi:hypothetical protein [Achromobacter spanius]|uniref:hypothetical protein n=1 Tax=Achromobacter spanius TaxID=217203 RepID=UPI0038046E4C